ncbi:MAG TPA: energy transducer TonB [Steroidobacteraceae bacterium]|nr:energy transducer TonB [Steroidobacteraceae bacterium]
MLHKIIFPAARSIKPLRCGIALALGLLCAAPIVHADFYNAFKNYQEKKFDEASVLFRDLAELGHGPSQFNLGVMYARGEAVEKDQGLGVGWMLAALENGHTQMSAQQLADFKSRLTPAQVADADKIVSLYGKRALERTLLPDGPTITTCRKFQYARIDQRAYGYYPKNAAIDQRDGVVLIRLTVGVDGLARDPHVVVSLPEGLFDDATTDIFLKSRFVPAERDGVKIESRVLSHFTFFHTDGGSLWQMKSVAALKTAAEQKNPNGQYLIGMIGALDSTLNVPREEAHAMLLSAAQAGHPNAQYWAANQTQYDRLCGSGAKSRTWLEHAAEGGDANAQVELAELRIAMGGDQLDIEEVKRLITSASGRDTSYALKHAIAILAASPNAALRNPQLALSATKKLRDFTLNADPQVDEAIAAGYAINADFREATLWQERAVKKAKALYWNPRVVEARLTEYRNGKTVFDSDFFAVPAATTPPPPVRTEARDCARRKRGCERVPDQERSQTGSYLKE